MTANIAGLQAAHLDSDKFTKFGPRGFDRQDVASTNASEAVFFGSISNYSEEIADLKVDVFADVGIATYYREVSFVQDGEGENAPSSLDRWDFGFFVESWWCRFLAWS